MNYRLFFIGLFFLFNPELTIIDILPDAIGFLLIARSLKPMAEVSPSADSAMRAFYKLSVLHTVKIAAILPMASVSSDEPSFSMLFTLAFGILSMLCLFPALDQLFASLDYFASRQGARIPHAGIAKGLLVISFLLRYVLAFLPESVFLFIDNNNVYDAAIYPLYSYRSGLMFVSFSLSFLLGLIFYLIIVRFFVKLKKMDDFNRGIREEIASLRYTREQVAMRSLVPTLRILSVFGVSMIAVTLDSITVFPSFLVSILLLLFYRFIKPLVLIPKMTIRLSVCALVVGIVANVLNLTFAVLYGEKAAIGFLLVKDKFVLPLVSEAVYTVILILLLATRLAMRLLKTLQIRTLHQSGPYTKTV